MAPIKRAADAEASNFKKGKHSNDHRAAKRPKTNSKPDSKEHKDAEKENGSKEKQLPVRSVLKNEEKAFPRGGASVLTPLEHKQIQIQATEDVLFEQSGTKRPAHGSGSEDESIAAPKKAEKKVKRRKRDRDTKGGAASVNAEPEEKIEGLSYKRLVPGSLVLGQVTQITPRDVTLALPNNLVGFVPLTAISDQLTKRVEKLLEADEEEKEEDVDDEFEDIDPNNLFQISQFLRAYVTSNGIDENKKRIELSLDPHLVNKGISRSDVVVDSMIQASVVSVEDHGLVMDLGLEDRAMKGFVGSKELGAGLEANKVEEGAVFLCLVTGVNSSGTIIKLSADAQKAGNSKRAHYLKDAPTVNAFLPGTSAEVLITEVTSFGVKAQIMGMLNVTADLLHSGGGQSGKDVEKRYTVGSKVRARILFSFPNGEEQRIGMSFLEHVLSFAPSTLASMEGVAPLEQLPLSSIVEEARVIKVETNTGLFLDVGVPRVQAFAHISRLSDKKIDMLSQEEGPYKLGSLHRARIVGFNPIDGVFLASLEKKVLEQPFLRVADVKVGQIAHGTVEKLVVNERGVGGVLVNIADGITGLVPEMHMADVHLQHPDRKFKEGMKVKARILSTNLDKKLIRMTLKKSLVNAEAEPWTSLDMIKVGDSAPGTLVNILPAGAVVHFYGDVQAFLPVAEMSEAFIKDPREHFRLGQVVNVHVLEVDLESRKMRVSCKDPSIFGQKQQEAYQKVNIGSIVSGRITEISGEAVNVDLKSGVKGSVNFMQLSDSSEKKCSAMLKGLRVGQKLKDLLVLEKQEKQHLLILSNKPSLIKAAASGKLLSSLDQVAVGAHVDGFIRSFADPGIFVQFAAGLVALLPVSGMSEVMKGRRAFTFDMQPGQSISAFVWSKKPERFSLTQLEELATAEKATISKASTSRPSVDSNLANPIDKVSKTIHDFTLGKRTTVKVQKVFGSQLNVDLADNVQGRIHVSELYKDFASIPHSKYPMADIKKGTTYEVKIIGLHEAKTHKFLAFSHRNSVHSVFECSVRQLDDEKLDELTISELQVGEERVAYITNYAVGFALVHLTAQVEGRISLLDFGSDDNTIKKDHPVGSALRVLVKHVDLEKGRITLAPLIPDKPMVTGLKDLEVGSIHSGRIVQVSERHLYVKLSDEIAGEVPLTELNDDYEKANPTTFDKNDTVRVRVAGVDVPNKRLYLTMRPSLLDASSEVDATDRHISNFSDLHPKDIVRGFVHLVLETGILVTLGAGIRALVLKGDIKDGFQKDWKEGLEVDQLVKGKIVTCDTGLKRCRMSLKKSVVDSNDWQPEPSWDDLEEGQDVNGTVATIMDYGVFILLDNSRSIRGLCHKTEMADGKVADVSKLYEKGDKVKAYIIKVDKAKKRVNFSLKASRFADLEADAEKSESDEEEDGVAVLADSDDDMDDGGVDLGDVKSMDDSDIEAEEDDAPDMDVDVVDTATKPSNGLNTGGFDWNGTLEQDADGGYTSDASHATITKKKKRRKAEIQIDKTGDLDKNGPQSTADFERQLLGEPNSSALWIQYMAFQLGLSEIEKAREISERALRTIHMREEDEKLNVWIAWLNLENAYGSEDSLESVFERACQHSDKKEMNQRLASIYIDSGKHREAESLFERMRKIKDISTTSSYWQNYATFLMTTCNQPDAARALLPRALQALPPHEHRPVTSRFAALEFQSENGDPERGRTIFEGLVETYKNRPDVWDMYVSLEMGKDGDKEKARALFERMSQEKMKAKRAKFVFKTWMAFEERVGSKRDVDTVRFKAEEYIDLHGFRKR